MKHRLPSLLLALVATIAHQAVPARAQVNPSTNPLPVGPDRRVKVYTLDTLEVVGTTRMSAEQLREELGLRKGIALNDELVMETRTRLLGLGLFRSAILMMRRGSQPGTAKLIIEVEDDESVLTDWAIGAELGVTASERATPLPDHASPMDYRVNLIGRNLLRDLHRGALLADIDSRGILREGQIAYGLPRFTAEDVQFDAEVAVVDPSHRYLNSMGFGGRAQGLWATTLKNRGEFAYGAAMYINEQPRYAVPGFPKSVMGPKAVFSRETRFHGFFPQAGYLLKGSLLFAPTKSEYSIVELKAAQTFDFQNLLYLTFDAHGQTLGTKGVTLRAGTRIDIPLGRTRADEDQAEIFVTLRGGSDRFQGSRLLGSAAVLGVRYHSSGFIAELALKIVKSPEDLVSQEFQGIEGVAPQ